ncbi:potassium voltage-gated channel subfamily A member 1-like isoform X3 [Bolinopsis microptera]|uniref:potassium voltage-gated channel subfamily A member 1-like isoform X3 n=1 Tax=Bolinopsis microptera TaxID=2820187 RepID=UPI003079EE93
MCDHEALFYPYHKPFKNHVSQTSDDPQGVNGGNKSREKSLISLAGSDHNDPIIVAEDLCRINVCGELFITTFKSLEEFPKTLLGSSERERYFCPELNAYFFNRNRACFESILLYYQTGDEYPPLTADLDLWEEEKAFFRISFTKDYAISIEDSEIDDITCVALCQNNSISAKRKAVHDFLLNPRSSKIATVWHSVDIMFICVSIAFLIMETDPGLKIHFTDKSDPYYNTIYGINAFVIAFFTIDLVARFFTWPTFCSFWKNIFNILDILSILPFYVGIIADMSAEGQSMEMTEVESKRYVVLRVCRIFRIIRIFKFVRHSQDLILIVRVVVHAKKELGLLVVLLGIFTVTFGSIMYYVEHEVNDQFNSIMQGCWWSIVTITTVGYGEVVPSTPGGKFVGSVVLTLGIVFLALPMTIIVSKFSSVYEKEKGDSKD